jgi:hypothetical protein
MVRAGLKAGIIMGIPLIVVEVIQYVARDVELLCLLIPVLWFVSGILAGRFGAAAALTTGAAAGAGALAGAITQVVVRIADVVMNLVMLALGKVSIPFSPGSIQWLAQLGLGFDEAEVFAYLVMNEAPVAAVDRVSACMLCVGVSIAMAAGLGAVGGIVGRAVSARRKGS